MAPRRAVSHGWWNGWGGHKPLIEEFGDRSRGFNILSVHVLMPFMGAGKLYWDRLGNACAPRRAQENVKSLIAVAIFCLGPWTCVNAQSEINYFPLATARQQARRELEEMGITQESRRKQAIENRGDRGEATYALQRLEVTGVGSTDDSNAINDSFFDDQAKPSIMNEEELRRTMRHEGVDRLVEKLKTSPGIISLGRQFGFLFLHDLRLAASETLLDITQRTENVFAEYQDKEINEIVAHSWGTEMVYNAIMMGTIKAPRRLIVVGVPDANVEKWRLLAAYTGTEVVMLNYSNDPVHAVVQKIEEHTDRIQRIRDTWNSRCLSTADHPKCRRYGRHGTVKVMEEKGPNDWLVFENHNRSAYYSKLQQNGYLEDRFKMAAAQDEAIQAEAAKLFEAELYSRALSIEAKRVAGIARLRALAQRYRREYKASLAATAAYRPTESDMLDLMGAINSIAQRSCYSYESVDQAELDHVPWRSASGLTADQRAGIGEGLNECEKVAFLHMMNIALDSRVPTLVGLRAAVRSKYDLSAGGSSESGSAESGSARGGGSERSGPRCWPDPNLPGEELCETGTSRRTRPN